MSAVRKFLFDVDFEHHPTPRSAQAKAEEEARKEAEAEQEPEEVVVPTFSEEDLMLARKSGFDEGRQAGVHEAAEAIEREIADALATVVGRLGEVFELQHKSMDETQGCALRLVHALTAKVFPRMAETAGLGEIEEMASDLLRRLRGEPRVVLSVAEAIAEPLRGRMAALAEAQGFDGRIEVIGDPALTAGDCRIEWSTGGAERNMKELLAEVDAIVAGNVDTPSTDLAAAEEAESAAAEPAAAVEGAESNDGQAAGESEDPDGPSRAE